MTSVAPVRPAVWDEARTLTHAAASPLPPVDLALADADGTTLAVPLVPLTDLPAFDTLIDARSPDSPSPRST